MKQYKMGWRHFVSKTPDKWIYDMVKDNINAIFTELDPRIKWHEERCPGQYVFEIFEFEKEDKQ